MYNNYLHPLPSLLSTSEFFYWTWFLFTLICWKLLKNGSKSFFYFTILDLFSGFLALKTIDFNVKFSLFLSLTHLELACYTNPMLIPAWQFLHTL